MEFWTILGVVSTIILGALAIAQNHFQWLRPESAIGRTPNLPQKKDHSAAIALFEELSDILKMLSLESRVYISAHIGKSSEEKEKFSKRIIELDEKLSKSMDKLDKIPPWSFEAILSGKLGRSERWALSDDLHAISDNLREWVRALKEGPDKASIKLAFDQDGFLHERENRILELISSVAIHYAGSFTAAKYLSGIVPPVNSRVNEMRTHLLNE
jgi:hypothetical protein